MINKRKIGAVYEIYAQDFLVNHGYEIRERNYRCKIGEIDIIAQDGEYLVFVEVKFRYDTRCGAPAEAVDYRKQRIISKVADYYCMTHGLYNKVSCRFDVVDILGVDQDAIEVIKNAFEYCG